MNNADHNLLARNGNVDDPERLSNLIVEKIFQQKQEIKYTIPEATNVINTINKAKTRGRPQKAYSDWITVEKRRASQNVIAHVVRIKDENGNKRVGYTDYMSLQDFTRRFSRKRADYEKYRQSLIAIYKAKTVSAGQGVVSNPGSSV